MFKFLEGNPLGNLLEYSQYQELIESIVMVFNFVHIFQYNIKHIVVNDPWEIFYT